MFLEEISCGHQLLSPPIARQNLFITTLLKKGLPVFTGNLSLYSKESLNNLLFPYILSEKAKSISCTGSIVFLANEELGIYFVEEVEKGESTFNVKVITTSLDILTRILQLKEPTPKSKGNISIILSDRGSPSIQKLGLGGLDLIRENYGPEVLRQYDLVTSEIISKSPAGRLVLISGEPGTGKTYLVRGLLQQAEQVRFVLLPSKMLGEVDTPDLAACLIQFSRDEEENRLYVEDYGYTFPKPEANTPIVLIVEDADLCLAKRDSDNISVISTVLNLSDGIFGSLLDLRIIATTNLAHLELDQAIKRPGRLLTHIRIEKFTAREAQTILNRMVPDTQVKLSDAFNYTLAEIYALANGRPIGLSSTDKKVGF